MGASFYMKINIEFNDQAKSGIEESFILNVAKKTLERKDFEFLKEKNISISLAAVAGEEIKKINSSYRKKDEETDILSFAEYEKKEDLERSGDNLYLGEVILCYNYIKKYANQDKKNLTKELARIISHGILHLLTLKHSEEMFSIQDEVGGSF